MHGHAAHHHARTLRRRRRYLPRTTCWGCGRPQPRRALAWCRDCSDGGWA